MANQTKPVITIADAASQPKVKGGFPTLNPKAKPGTPAEIRPPDRP